MGTWGSGLYQNDASMDIKDTYLSKLKGGKSDEVALVETLDDFQNELSDEEEKYNVIFALADVMWKHGRLTEEMKEKALNCIDFDLQTDKWKENKVFKARSKVLDKLRKQLLSKMPERKKISVHKPVKLGWRANEVYAFQIKSKIEGYEKYIGYYAVFFVKKIYKKDWIVKDVWDEIAEAYFYLTRDKPDDPYIVETATPVCFLLGKKSLTGSDMGNRYLVDIIETSKRMRPKDLYLVGIYEGDKIYHPKEHRTKGNMSWQLYERDILWGYENQLKYEGKLF